MVNVITGFMNAFQQPAQSVAIGILVPKELYARDSSNEQIMGIVRRAFVFYTIHVAITKEARRWCIEQLHKNWRGIEVY